MLRRIALVVVGTSCLLVTLTWLELWNSPSGNQVPPQQAQAQNTSQSDSGSPSKQPESISFWQRTVRDPINLFTGVLAITIILAAASIYQGWQTQQSVEISKRALTDLERPYLFILDYNWLESGLVYSVANGGKLPAFIKGVKLGIEIGGPTPPDMDDEPLVHDLMTAPLIGAGEQRKVIQGFTDENGGDVVECQIRGGKATIPSSILKAGRMITKISIEYDGPITTGHTTTACWEWHPVKYAFTHTAVPSTINALKTPACRSQLIFPYA